MNAEQFEGFVTKGFVVTSDNYFVRTGTGWHHPLNSDEIEDAMELVESWYASLYAVRDDGGFRFFVQGKAPCEIDFFDLNLLARAKFKSGAVLPGKRDNSRMQ
jgi:hypothetical protein